MGGHAKVILIQAAALWKQFYSFFLTYRTFAKAFIKKA